jgi:hypothetical protein
MTKTFTLQYKQQNSRNMLTNKSHKSFKFVVSTSVYFWIRFLRWGYSRQPPTLEWALAMTKGPLSLSDQSQDWKKYVTVSLWGMKRASTPQGAVGQSGNSGRKGGNSLSIKLYRTGRHPLFPCEWIVCTISNNKPSMPLSRRVKHKFLLLEEGRGSAADTIHNLCLISKTVLEVMP